MSIAEFFHMGGFGLYIWSSFSVTLVLMIAEIITVKRQHRTITQRLSRMLRMSTKVNQ